MSKFKDKLAEIEATLPQEADITDIRRATELLENAKQDDIESQVSLLLKLGSFFLENRSMDANRALEMALECYEKVRDINSSSNNVEYTFCAMSGIANCLSRRYRYTHESADMENSEEAYVKLLGYCDTHDMLSQAVSVRINYATMLQSKDLGDRFNNIEKAIGLLRGAIEQLSGIKDTVEFNSQLYVRVQYNLAAALLKQNDEPHVKSINNDEAIGLLLKVLEYRTPERDIVGRIRTLRALAKAYPEWSGADSLTHAQYLSEAASAEADALEQSRTLPKKADWAVLMSQKSALHWDIDEVFSGEDARERMLAAIKEHKVNIDKISYETLPALWAEWLGGYARLLGRIGVEDGNANYINNAQAAFLHALNVVSVENQPRLSLLLNREYGRICHESQLWETSLEINRRAFEIGFSLYSMATSSVARANELEASTRAAHFAVYAAAKLNLPAEAIELAEMSRARWLDDAIRCAEIRNSNVSNELKKTVDDAQARLLELERTEYELLNTGVADISKRLQDILGGNNFKIRVTRDPQSTEAERRRSLQNIREKLIDARNDLSMHIDSISAMSTNIPATKLDSTFIQNLVLENGIPLVYLLATTWGSAAIIVGKTLEVLLLPNLERSHIQKILYDNNSYAHLSSSQDPNAFESSLLTIENTIATNLIAPIKAWGSENGVDSFAIIGLGDIGLLPLQVAAIPAGINIQSLPCARILTLHQRDTEGIQKRPYKLLTIGGPKSDGLNPLPFSEIESQMFAVEFKKNGIDVKAPQEPVASKDVEEHIAKVTHMHLACHGTYRPSSPLGSMMHLTGAENLPVESLLRPAMKLAGVKLVILSACNSASSEKWRTPDEAIGFPAAFLVAGCKTVIAAQWDVSDVATLFLMQHFSKELLKCVAHPAKVLAESQRWLREVEVDELVKIIVHLQENLGEAQQRNKRILSELSEQLISLEDKAPFSARINWAGFVCVGA